MQLTPEFVTDLMQHIEFVERPEVLKQGLIFSIRQSIHFYPRSTRLVAYHNMDKTAIGFLSLNENPDKLYLIGGCLRAFKLQKDGIGN